MEVLIKNEPEAGIIDNNGDGNILDDNHFDVMETPHMQFLDPLKRIQFLEAAGLSDDLLEMPAEDKTFGCNVCGKLFKRKSHLTRHGLLHTGAKPFACDFCEERFTRSENRARHVVQVHQGGTRYKCKACKQVFTAWSALQEHSKVHAAGRPYACDICDNRYSRKDKLDAHKLSHLPRYQETVRRYPCEICGRTFTRKDHMKRHKGIHLGIKMHECAHCCKRFSRKDNQVKHENSCTGSSSKEPDDASVDLQAAHSGDFASTGLCAIESVDMLSLEMNEDDLMATDSTPNGAAAHSSPATSRLMPSSRDGAVEIFLVKEQRAQSNADNVGPSKHVKGPEATKMQTQITPDYTPVTLPSGEQYLRCNLCAKRFRHKHHLIRHQHLHFGIKPFKCGQCDRAFARKEHLTRHIAVHEKNYKEMAVDDEFIIADASDPLATTPEDMLNHTYQPYDMGQTKAEAVLDIDENSGQYVSSLLEISMTSSMPITPSSNGGDIKVESDEHNATFDWRDYEGVAANAAAPLNNSAMSNDGLSCDKCDKKFPKAFLLARHYAVHTGEKRYKCDICQREFSRLEHQKRHMAIHSNDRSYECDLCNRKFSRSDHLFTHMKGVHAGVKPYPCSEMCGQRFFTFREREMHSRECTARAHL